MANITKLQPPSRLVSDLSDLPALGLSACVLNRSSHLSLVQRRFPSVRIEVVDAPAVGGLLSALKEGRCAAAVGPNTAFLNTLGISDPAGRLCGLDFAGFPIETGAPTPHTHASRSARASRHNRP